MDRTVATGTGFIGQYSPGVAAQYESLDRCPDELVLFMHHVPYTHVLHSGKTVIQHIYDVHYQGADQAAQFVSAWQALKGRIDDERYEAVLGRLRFQEGHAIVWRDAICSWFLKTSGIPDANGSAGHFAGRTEAETMRLDGYRAVEVKPWETAGGGKAVECADRNGCSARFSFSGQSGSYRVVIRYFDENDGRSRFTLRVGDRSIGEWVADDTLPSADPNGHSSTWYVVDGVTLHTDDDVRIEGSPDAGEHAVVDYVEITPGVL